MSEEAVSRAELVEARERLIEQLERVRRPVLLRDRNRQLATRLQIMIDEINELLATDDYTQ